MVNTVGSDLLSSSADAPSAAPLLIEACDLSKSYGAAAAVRHLSFAVRRGEVVGFLGPNGAGKSTTMKMLTGFLKPSMGIAKVGGIDVAADPMAVRRQLGYLPENAPLYDDMMVIDFLRFIADLRGVRRSEQTKRLRQTCERCGLMGVLGKDIGQLSKGYRQRVGLAQALVHDPDLLILDEPTSGLDPNQIIEIRQLIRDLGREKTVMLSTHILSEVHATCSRVLIINDGQLVADGRPDALSAGDTQQQAQRRLLVSFRQRPSANLPVEQVANLLQALPGVLEVEAQGGQEADCFGFRLLTQSATDVRESIFDLAVQQQLILLGMQQLQGSLEETFRRLTRHPSAGAIGRAKQPRAGHATGAATHA
jgi:ABC-2 type transport system ATP-binding protein